MVDDTHLSRWVEQDRRLDHARGYIAQFKDFIQEGFTVIDAGTSIGDHTLTYAQMVGPKGKVLGFEANPDVAECAALNMSQFPWVTVYNVGLSDGYGTCGIDINPNVGASHLIANSGQTVSLKPLDHYLDELTRCDFIKVDVEGFEVRLLKGAQAIIDKFGPRFVMEINSAALDRQGFSPENVFRFFKQNGYSWKVVDGIAGTPQYDIMARRR